MSHRRFSNSRNINNPLGKKSVFYTYYDDPVGVTYSDEIPEGLGEGYIYIIVPCDSGVDVFEKYKSNQYTPKTNEIYIFIERKDSGKSNLFGTACRVKMGEKRRLLMIELLNNKANISVHDNPDVRGLERWAIEISEKNKGTDKEIDKDVLVNAVRLELLEQNEVNQFLEEIFSLNNKLSDWMDSGVEAMEEWKFTKENYDYENCYTKPMYDKYHGFQSNRKVCYKPIIPVKIPNQVYKTMAGASVVAAAGLSSLIELADKIEDVAFAITYTIVKASPSRFDDVLLALIYAIKNQIEEKVFGRFKQIIKKIKEILDGSVSFIKEISSKIGEYISEQLAILNAFLCGLINGIISLLQTIVAVVSIIVDRIPVLELEKVNPTAITAQQEKLEFIEDLIDIVSDNTTKIFTGIITMVTDTKIFKEAISFFKEIAKKIGKLNKYFWAFFIGAVVFELILDAIIAFFTAGGSLVAKVTAKISRLATKVDDLAKKGVKLGKTFGRQVANDTSVLLKWLKREFEELVEAIEDKRFIEWLREKLFNLFRIGKKAELKLRGKPIILKGFRWKKIKYVKRKPVEVSKLRNKFDSKIRTEFLKDLLKKSGIKTKLKKVEKSQTVGMFITNSP